MSIAKNNVYGIENYKNKKKNDSQRIENIEKLLCELVGELKGVKETLKNIENNK
ncbi:hypothetical protein [Tepidibacter hydrothermalis]|uniref:Uncharacterized protein n=1 Tax=Tepidibacter hydrothermalis TaxID=3036126 RepID=A0ABY8EIF6_9FIRM|nr:hypothetical protein [Tepidibacter hydrothermalis]WFD10588.1 hypothetical protein P4S50_00510 [Tepidibacter hydrothermalis]